MKSPLMYQMIENSGGIFVTITDVKITDTLVKFVSPITQSNAYVKILLIGIK